jgi:hypothetical protein
MIFGNLLVCLTEPIGINIILITKNRDFKYLN